MKVLVCDACKTVLEEKPRECYDYIRGFDLCVECKEKFEKIKEEYYKQDNELEKERDKLFNNYKEKLKEIGLNYDN